MCTMRKDGFLFAFNPDVCRACGGFCCCGESGYIFVNRDEMMAIADYLQLRIEDFYDRFVYRVGVRFSLIEKPHAPSNGYACVFFDEQKLCCSIYEVRPKQCVDFPFWNANYGIGLKEMKKQCPFLDSL